MTSKQDGGFFNPFYDDDSDWDANLDYEHWGSGGDLDATSIDNEIADRETTRSTDSAAGSSLPFVSVVVTKKAAEQER